MMTVAKAVETARVSALMSKDRHGYMPSTTVEAATFEPHGWVVDAIRAASNSEVVAPSDLPSFDAWWAQMEARGYRYGDDALENVKLGFQGAIDLLTLALEK